MIYKGSLLFALLLSTAVAFPQYSDDYEYDYDDNPEEETGDDNVPVPNFVVNEPKHIVVKQGADAVIPCQIEEETIYALLVNRIRPGRLLALFVDNTKVVRTRRFQRFEINNGDVTISKVRPNDAGIYECIIQASEPRTIEHTLEVQYPPKLNKTSDQQLRVKKGESVTLECQAGGNPIPSIHWSKLDGKLPSGAKDEEGFSMTLQDVDRHVEGDYVCTASNGIGESATYTMNVAVEYEPEILTEKSIVRTGAGDQVDLVCIVHSRPMANVVWTKDGNEVPFDSHQVEMEIGHRHTLTISHVSEDDFGSFECTATNKLGTTSSIIQLSGHPKAPEITSDPNSKEDTSHTITWNTKSFYPIEEYDIRYRKAQFNDTHMPEWKEETVEATDVDTEGLKHTLTHTLENLEPDTDYHGVLKVRNRYNWSATSEFAFSTKKDVIDLPQPQSTGGQASAGVSCVLLLLLPTLLLRT